MRLNLRQNDRFSHLAWCIRESENWTNDELRRLLAFRRSMKTLSRYLAGKHLPSGIGAVPCFPESAWTVEDVNRALPGICSHFGLSSDELLRQYVFTNASLDAHNVLETLSCDYWHAEERGVLDWYDKQLDCMLRIENQLIAWSRLPSFFFLRPALRRAVADATTRACVPRTSVETASTAMRRLRRLRAEELAYSVDIGKFTYVRYTPIQELDHLLKCEGAYERLLPLDIQKILEGLGMALGASYVLVLHDEAVLRGTPEGALLHTRNEISFMTKNAIMGSVRGRSTEWFLAPGRNRTVAASHVFDRYLAALAAVETCPIHAITEDEVEYLIAHPDRLSEVCDFGRG